MPKTLLPDINVWLALAFDGHAHHQIATEWFDGLTDESCAFSRITQQGFLRIASNPAVFKANALDTSEAWRAFDLFLSDPRVSFLTEPSGIDPHWRSLTEHRTYSPHVWSDAYLAAFAQAGQMELVTFDRALSSYAPGPCTLLA